MQYYLLHLNTIVLKYFDFIHTLQNITFSQYSNFSKQFDSFQLIKTVICAVCNFLVTPWFSDFNLSMKYHMISWLCSSPSAQNNPSHYLYVYQYQISIINCIFQFYKATVSKLLSTSKMRICGPKLSLCGLIISVWGIIQLVSNPLQALYLGSQSINLKV